MSAAIIVNLNSWQAAAAWAACSISGRCGVRPFFFDTAEHSLTSHLTHRLHFAMN
jgi:hypothetical protein